MPRIVKTVLQVCGLVALSLATIAITSTIISRGRPVKAGEQVLLDEGVALDPSCIASSPSVGLTNLQSLEWNNVAAGVVTVNASLNFRDTSQDHTLFWRLQVLQEPANADGSYTVLSTTDYLTQSFQVAAGTQVQPTFSDTVNLNPGAYTVRISLQESKEFLQDDGSTVTNTVEWGSDLAMLNVQ